MRTFFTTTACLFVLLLAAFHERASSQGNIDWETLWVNVPIAPTSPSHHTGWMQPARSFTGLAYDKWRDVVYVVNPAVDAQGNAHPRIHIWDAATGQPAVGVGRSAHPFNAGAGAELPVPLDTLGQGVGVRYGFDRNRFSLYKIDLDDEGRIFACNLVSPLWGICILLPNAQCDPVYLNQGPFRVWRWDTPTSTPMLTYATLNTTASAIGSLPNSEQTYTRWGDGFDVIGRRSLYDPGNGNPPYEVDSVRIYTSGGSFPGMPEWNREVNVILADTRAPALRPDRDTPGGGKLDMRLAVKLSNSLSGLAAHGVAATGTSLTHDVWMDSNPRLTTVALHVQHPTNPWPQTYLQTAVANRSLSTNITGPSGPIRYFEILNRKFIIVADGMPTGGADTSIPNGNTTARIIDVTTPASAVIQLGPTPQLGNRTLDDNGFVDDYIAAVDFQLRSYSVTEDPDEPGTHIILFVLMSNNGIAAYRSRKAVVPIPVELTSFQAAINGGRVDLAWDIAMEANNHGFEVQRSFDGGSQWDVIGFVPGRGSSTEAMRYRFSDEVTSTHRGIGRVVYRLRQIDHDGSDWLSPTSEVYFEKVPNTVSLQQNYPNPFNPSTAISYSIAEAGHVALQVFNSLGEVVALLVDEYQPAGTHQIQMSAAQLPAGVYLCRISAGGHSAQKKMTLVK